MTGGRGAFLIAPITAGGDLALQHPGDRLVGAGSLAIVNPASRGGSTRRRWPAIERRLRERLGAVDVVFTRAPRDAERIAREAALAGTGLLIIAGGDGTASEVASGLLAAGLGERADLALLPLGTGGDLRRGLGMPARLEAALERVATGGTRRIDAARVRYRATGGGEATRHVVNVASLGVSALATRLASRGLRLPGGRLTFLLAAVRAIARWESPPVRIELDGACVHEGPLVLAAAASGPCFGGGMRVAPDARPDDGVLDLVVVRGASRGRLLRSLPRIYRGTHLELDEVSVARGTRVEATSAAEVWIEADGETLGTLPASIELLPAALGIRGVDP